MKNLVEDHNNEYAKLIEPNYTLKYIIVGDSGSGKSCIVNQYINKKFNYDHDSTIGVEYGSRHIVIDNLTFKVQIWDTAGQEKFNSIIKSYYRGSNGIILVYDITREETFYNLTKWVKEIKSALKDDKIQFIVVANKTDLIMGRRISHSQGKKYADSIGAIYIETSAKASFNIEDIFFQLTRKIYLDKVSSISSKVDLLENEKVFTDKKYKCCNI